MSSWEWHFPHCVELFVRRGVLVCQERCPCLSGEVSLFVRRGVLVCQERCLCLSGEVSLSIRRGVLVCQERCPCLSGEVSLSVRRGVLVCQEWCPCLSGEVSLSVRRGVLVCQERCPCLSYRSVVGCVLCHKEVSGTVHPRQDGGVHWVRRGGDLHSLSVLISNTLSISFPFLYSLSFPLPLQMCCGALPEVPHFVGHTSQLPQVGDSP